MKMKTHSYLKINNKIQLNINKILIQYTIFILTRQRLLYISFILYIRVDIRRLSLILLWFKTTIA